VQAPSKNLPGCALRQAKQVSFFALTVGQYLARAAAHCCGVCGDLAAKEMPAVGLDAGGPTLPSSQCRMLSVRESIVRAVCIGFQVPKRSGHGSRWLGLQHYDLTGRFGVHRLPKAAELRLRAPCLAAAVKWLPGSRQQAAGSGAL
jgi:hypothetical protein